MNTKLRLNKLRNISPDYFRIPHLDKNVSNMTMDDIEFDSKITFPFECWVQEKVDGANMGVSWSTGPVLRNRNHILKKGYIDTNTPSKLQFRPAWSWLHEHNRDIRFISNELKSPITIYGEWMWAKHSIGYDKLPDWFLAYDIYVYEEDKFLSPKLFSYYMSQTNIKFILSNKKIISSVEELIKLSEDNSNYRTGICEGIVIKTEEDKYLDKCFKIVNNKFIRREDFNSELIRNSLKK